MKILDRYISALYASATASAFGVGLSIALLVEVLEKSRVLLSGKLDAVQVVLFIGYRAADLSVWVLPVAFVAGISLAHAYLGRRMELRALAAAGVGPWRFFPLALVVGLIVLAFELALAQWVVPAALERQVELEKKTGWIDRGWRFFPQRQWFKGQPGRLFRVVGRSRDGTRMGRVELFVHDKSGQIVRIVRANNLKWKGNRWVAKKAEVMEFDRGRLAGRRKSNQAALDWPEGPETFKPLHGRPRQMTMGQLRALARELEARGARATSYFLEFHQRLAIPLLALLLALSIMPWQIAPWRMTSVAMALLQSALLILSAYIVVAFCTAAASGGIMSEAMAAWLPVLPAGVGCVLAWLWLVPRLSGGKSA